ncbi:hypothetical protein GCM10023168_36290 [Fodinibacter luteus]|uniref:DUF7144 domain-containing protein n=1 Tax=Fodinibacter luteus TaxID=552064 RepID=A0ABP8KQG1_9MICO
MSYENTSLTTNLDDGRQGQRYSGSGGGLVSFAAVMLIMVGIFHAIQGLVALLNDDFFVVGREYVFQFDLTSWGWIHLLVGLGAVAAGAGLFLGKMWARVFAVVVASLSMLSSFMWLPFYPLWSLTLISLDVLVIWAAIVHGRDLVDE